MIAGTTLTNANSVNDSDGFLAKYIDNGTSVSNGWAIKFGGATVPSSDVGNAIAINGNNLYLTGSFYGTATIANTTLTSGGQSDFFLAKYDLSTSPATGRWAVGGGSVRADAGNAVAVNGNNVYVGGVFSNSITLNGTTFTTSALNDRNLFLAKYIDNGSTVGSGWALGEGSVGTSADNINSLKVIGGDIYTTGTYGGVGATIAGTTLVNSTGGGSHMYVAKYSDNGSSATGQWASGVTTSSSSNGSAGNDLEVSGNTVLVTGTFAGNATIAGTSLVNKGTIGGDAFLARYTDNGTSVAANGAISAGSATDSDQGYGVHLRGTTAYVTGYTARTGATFGSYTLSSTGISVVPFIARASIPAQTGQTATVTTATPNSINTTGAVLGGSVTTDGGSAVTARGVVYSSTNTNPTTSDTRIQIGTGTGTFSQAITSLTPATTYYTRAFATNSVGTSYGSAQSFMTTANPTTVLAINRASATPSGASTVSFTVSFASAVSGLSVSNFALVSSGVNTPSISSLSGSGATYTVTVNTGSGSGTLQLRLVNATGLTPGVSNLPFEGQTYTIDKDAPLVTSVSVPASATYRTGQTLNFTVNFSENTLVTGSPQLGLTIGSVNRQASYVSGSGSSALLFAYVLQSGDLDTDGIALASALMLNGGSMRDGAGNAATLSLNGVASTAGVLVDAVAPLVSSSSRQSPVSAITNATSLLFRVSFSEPVSGVTANSFILTTTSGSAIGTIAGVTAVGSNNAQYDINVSGVNGSGVLRLDVKSSGSGIIDLAGNSLNGGFSSGQAFTIDQIPPVASISSSLGASGTVTRLSPIPFSVSFSESVTGFEASEVGVTNGSLANFTGSGPGPYTFVVTPSGNGLVSVNISANAAQDAAGNGNTASNTFSIDYQPLTITGFVASANSVCTGSSFTVTATVSNATGPYAYTLTNGPQTITGNFTGAAFSRSLTATGQGLQSFTLTVTDASQTAIATQNVTVNPLPFPTITNLASAYCQDAGTVTLMASPAGGSFAIDGTSATQFNPAILAIGNRSVDYRYTDANGCANTATQIVRVKATPPTPTLLTQSGGAYPASQSAVTVDVNSGNVNLVVGGCAGTISWNGPANSSGTSNTIAVGTSQAGTFTYQANCTVDGCTSLLATAVVTVGGKLTVLHRDVDNYADNNAIQPLIELQNQGLGNLPLSNLTLRYYLTVEGAAPLNNLSVSYAQVGNGNVQLRYVPLSPAQQGAAGYVEYSFTAGAGSLAPGASSGPIQAYFAKSDYSGLNELDDYSYAIVRNQLVGTQRITAYYNGVLIAGVEPGSTTQIRALRALTESKNGPSATQISTYLTIRNEGNVGVNYSDLRARYYFTSDGTERLQVEVDEGNVQTQLVALNPAVDGANYYLEIRFNQSGQLAPGASADRVRYRISKPDGGRFDQTNDYSYQEQPAESSANSRVVLYVGADRVWGREPGAAFRIAVAEPASELEVTVLGNPLRGDVVSVQVKGTGTEPLQLQLVSAQGRVITTRQIASPRAIEQHDLSAAGAEPGVLLLQVSTPTKRQTVRVLKGE